MSTELATVNNGHQQLAHFEPRSLSGEQVDLVKRTICKEASDDELALFIGVCNRTGLDPFTKQIYAIFRYDRQLNRKVMQVQVGIDGMRVTAQRSGFYGGRVGPWWCGADGVWRDVWLDDEPPMAARVGVLRKGCEPIYAVATYKSFCQKKDGRPLDKWQTMPDVMLAKCAEAQANRVGFPNDLSGMYIKEEMPIEQPDGPDKSEPPVGKVKAGAKPELSDAGKRYRNLAVEAKKLGIPFDKPAATDAEIETQITELSKKMSDAAEPRDDLPGDAEVQEGEVEESKPTETDTDPEPERKVDAKPLKRQAQKLADAAKAKGLSIDLKGTIAMDEWVSANMAPGEKLALEWVESQDAVLILLRQKIEEGALTW